MAFSVRGVAHCAFYAGSRVKIENRRANWKQAGISRPSPCKAQSLSRVDMKQFMSTISAQAPRRWRPRTQFHQLRPIQNNKATARVALLFCLVEPAGIEPASANPPLPVLRV